jgi:hypothetical protein
MDRKSLGLMDRSDGLSAHLKEKEQQLVWARRAVKSWIHIAQSAVACCQFYGF